MSGVRRSPRHSHWTGQGRLTKTASCWDSLGLWLILTWRSESEAAEQPDYVCLMAVIGAHLRALPPGRKRGLLLSQGYWKSVRQGRMREHNSADAMYEQMLFLATTGKELFRRWRRRTSSWFHCSGGKDRTGVALCSSYSAGALMKRSVTVGICPGLQCLPCRPELEKIQCLGEPAEVHPGL